MKITIVSGIQLSNNPRVVKEADALAEAGFDVTVLCSLLDPSYKDREQALFEGKKWRPVQILDFNNADSATVFYRRLRTRLANEVYRFTGRGSVSQLGYVGPELLRECLKNPADLYSVHLEQAFCVGAELCRRGFRVAADFEDWYSEDLLPEARARRPVKLLAKSEQTLLEHSEYTLSTSQSLSNALAQHYSSRAPLVVANTFSLKERESLDGKTLDRRNSDLCSLVWVSQNIGPMRGIEQLMEATEFLAEPIEIHLRGRVSKEFKDKLLGMASPVARPHIYFHPQIPHSELLSRISEHDIGYAAEPGYCPNNNLTVSNKIYHYLLAGIPIIATSTAGQSEVADELPGCIRVFSPNEPQELAAHIGSAQSGEWSLKEAGKVALQAALSKYNWEHSKIQLIDAVQKALSGHAPRPHH